MRPERLTPLRWYATFISPRSARHEATRCDGEAAFSKCIVHTRRPLRMTNLSTNGYRAGLFTVLSSLVLITPLCGLLFDCGCTWPWSGLESDCNIHDPAMAHQCPWCASTIAGVVSVSLAIAMGFLMTIRRIPSSPYAQMPDLYAWHGRSLIPAFIKRVGTGLAAFFVTAVVTGWVSGYLVEYPYFVLNQWLSF